MESKFHKEVMSEEMSNKNSGGRNRKFDLQDRLIRFACDAIDIAESLPKSFSGNHIACQLVRSSTSPALNYGEAQAAESRNDFIHKMKICLKELRETYVCVQLILLKQWIRNDSIEAVNKENNELISVFVTSLKTAQNRGKTPNTSKF